MNHLTGRTACVTGGASGFGLALAKSLLQEGMNVVIADVSADRTRTATAQLEARDGTLSTVVCDVSNRAAVQAAAEHAIARFGRVHVLCNNAGVLAPGPLDSGNIQDWTWSFSVNVLGIIHGLEAFLPHMRQHGEEGHVVITASMAGLRGLPNAGPYCASKAAAISIGESLSAELADTHLGVSVLCPGFMRTSLYRHGLNRPNEFGGPKETLLSAGGEQLREAIAGGIDPGTVARRTIRAIRNNELYVITHPQHRSDIAARAERILAAYDRAAVESVS